MRTTRLLLLLAILPPVISCRREDRRPKMVPPSVAVLHTTKLSPLEPGDEPPHLPIDNPYEQNAVALSEGKRLFAWFNCVGCHANGGGGMGPPLMDDKWIYGSNPDQIVATIIEGRPNGMPSFGGKIPDFQVWQLAAYVRSMSGQVPPDAAPSRDDHMNVKDPESRTKKETPVSAAGEPQ